jgi:hypothetical protein
VTEVLHVSNNRFVVAIPFNTKQANPEIPSADQRGQEIRDMGKGVPKFPQIGE